MNTVIDFTPEIIDEAEVTLDDINKSDKSENVDKNDKINFNLSIQRWSCALLKQ